MIIDECPKWPESIEDAYELEGSIIEQKDIDQYIRHLLTVICRTSIEGRIKLSYVAHATARQRCEAWLMLMEGEGK
jgi:hypothetical protein